RRFRCRGLFRVRTGRSKPIPRRRQAPMARTTSESHPARWIARAALLALLVASPARAGLNQWTRNGPEGGALLALRVVPSAPSTIDAGTNAGVFKSQNAGASWAAATAGIGSTTVNALAVDPLAASTVYAGTNGGVFKTTTAGSSWTAARTGLPARPVRPPGDGPPG